MNPNQNPRKLFYRSAHQSYSTLDVFSVAPLCVTLCDPKDCSPPGSFFYGIFQARIIEWSPFPPPGDLPDPGIESVSQVSWH